MHIDQELKSEAGQTDERAHRPKYIMLLGGHKFNKAFNEGILRKIFQRQVHVLWYLKILLWEMKDDIYNLF